MNAMTLDEYQKESRKTAMYPKMDTGDLTHPALGLNGEAGEVAEHAKKIISDDGGRITTARSATIAKEVGDALWYIAQLATELGMPLSQVAQINLDKLRIRKAGGRTQGSGSDR